MAATREVPVLLLEPDDVTGAALAAALRDGIAAAGSALALTDVIGTVAEAHERAEQRTGDGPAVLLAGPTCSAAELVPAVPALLARRVRTVVLADHSLDEGGTALLLAGASGYLLLADTAVPDIVASIDSVAHGETALHPEVVHAVLERWRGMRESPASAAAEPGRVIELTAREREVLGGLHEGLTNRVLAARLGLAEKTVENHRTRLYAKLGARNQAHAVRIAMDRGLL